MRSVVLFVVFYLAWVGNAFCQKFKMEKPDAEEKKEGVIAKYIYNVHGSGLFGIILLYKNNEFYYSEGTDIDHIYSKGNWRQRGDIIILESFFSKDGLPIKINYIDTVDIVQDQLFHVVKNKGGKPLTDAFVQINNKTIEYLPLGDVYTSKPERLDSVRVRFEKGFVSNWAKVENRPYKALSIIVLTCLDIKDFVLLDQWKFKKTGNQLERVEE